MHSFLAHLASEVDPVPYFERMDLLQVDQDRTVQPLKFLFSVPVGLYSKAWQIFAFRRELTSKGLHPMVELPMDDFGVWRSVCAVPREDHISHLEGVTPSVWQVTPCEKLAKAAEGGSNLACQWLTFVAPDGAAHILGNPHHIAETIQLLFLLLAGLAPPFEDILNWIQFTYATDRTGEFRKRPTSREFDLDWT